MSMRWRRLGAVSGAVAAAAAIAAVAALGAAPPNSRLSTDVNGGYVSADALAGLSPYTDATLTECGRSRGRQNEPSVAVDPRDTRVIVGSSNDYCGVYDDGADANGAPIPSGPIWLGYYRSENGGGAFQGSLVPGYPGDTSASAALAGIRTASSGDPVLAWDADGRLFMGSESSADPAGSKKGFGDVWVARYVSSGPGTLNDGKRFAGSVIVDRGSSSPATGKFNDKTAIETDRTTNAATRGNVYFAYSRFTGNGGVGIYFSRSTDHGATFSAPVKLSASIQDVQFPDIAVTGSGHVYVVFRRFADKRSPDAVVWTVSTNGGRTFSPPRVLTTFTRYDASDSAAPVAAPPQSSPDDPVAEDPDAAGSSARDCGSLAAACASGYTFFRRDTQVRATADQAAASEDVHVVYDPTVPGTEVATGTTYGSVRPGTGSQSGVYYVRLDGATGASTAPAPIAPEITGHQLMPDIAASGGVLHAIWWDSRNDPAYSPARPIGNDAAGHVVPSLDVYAATRPAASRGSWTAPQRLTSVTSNPNFEQFAGRTVPFAGDYLWVSSEGGRTFATWTDWRDTVAGTDQREPGATDGADVLQCRSLVAGVLTGDLCPRAGGLDQNVYGAVAP